MITRQAPRQRVRLPVCILADGLYPYENAFKICEKDRCKFIFVLQDGSLKTVQEELTVRGGSAFLLEILLYCSCFFLPELLTLFKKFVFFKKIAYFCIIVYADKWESRNI